MSVRKVRARKPPEKERGVKGDDEEKKRLTVYILPDLDKRLRHEAVDRGVSLTDLVTELLESGLK